MKHNRFLSLARAASMKSDHHTHKMGAVIVNGSRVVGVGWNQIKTTPKSNHPYRMVHCELDAILDCNKEYLEGADIYVFREHKDGTWACAKPCPYCQELLFNVGIRNAYYTDENEFKKMEIA